MGDPSIKSATTDEATVPTEEKEEAEEEEATTASRDGQQNEDDDIESGPDNTQQIADEKVTRDSASNSQEHSPAAPTEKKSQMQALEIDDGRQDQTLTNTSTDESFDNQDDMEHLLSNDTKASSKKSEVAVQQRQMICGLCEKPETVGNMKVFLPSCVARTGWGIAGPHWFGPLCVLLLVGFASHYFIRISTKHVGPITSVICVLFTVACGYNLINVAYRDPGVVKLQPVIPEEANTDEDQRLQFRWCDRCQIFQPPDGAHCSDCNVCIAGFDQ